MKGVHCSWVDLQRIREALSAGRRGDQAALENIRCVAKATVSAWKGACYVLDAVDGKVPISELSHFQPSHATEIARALRKEEKRPSKWTPEMKDRAADWIDRVEAERLTVAQLVDALRAEEPLSPGQGCTTGDLLALADSGKKFGTVYADPPWAYGNQATRASTDNHYKTMPVADIAALPVARLVAECSHLHLWTTNGFLREAFGLIDAWGFAYKSLLVWDKDRMGIGNYWRVQTEFLLLGVRGGLTFAAHDLPNVLRADRSGHSAKPEQARLMVERASPGPRLELFGRRAVEGWTVWGDQIERDLFHHGNGAG